MVASLTSPIASSVLPTGADPFAALRARVTGAVIGPGTEAYEAARTVLNFREMGRRPQVIVQPADEKDVAATVAFVREHGLRLAVRSGGHGLSAGAEVDGGVLIDLSTMANVTVDPVGRLARIQPGATSNVVAAAAHEHGLALSTGDTGSVGMGGLGTGGGIGFMVRAFGLTVDNIVSARVVTADGRIRVASAIENPDLFWAIRGGGSNFGIVTEFTVRLAPVDQIYGGLLVLPATREVLDHYLHHGIGAPDELTTIGNVMACPPMPFIAPEHVGKRVLAIFVCWSGSPEAGEAALAPLRALAEPIADLVNVMPYPAIYQFTGMQEAPHGDYIRSMFAADLSCKALDSIISAIDEAPVPMCVVQIRPLGGAMSRVDKYATAFPHRESNVLVAIIGMWMDPSEDGELHKSWVMQTWAALRSEGSGVYVNFLEDEGAERTAEAYGKTTYDRLAQIKRVYDPENLFRHNQNIAPAS